MPAPLPTLYFPDTSHTPKVDFRYVDATNRLTGVCDPGNVAVFFQPLFQWLEAFAANKNAASLDLIIDLEFISTPSERYLRKLIDRLRESRDCLDKTIRVTWRVATDNDPMLRTAQRMKDSFGAPKWFDIAPS